MEREGKEEAEEAREGKWAEVLVALLVGAGMQEA